MMALILSGTLVLMLVAQLAGSAWYQSWLRKHKVASLQDQEFPKAAIILSLRGADPTLAKCLDQLTELNYPDYQIHVVIDHETDPACAQVSEWLSHHPASPIIVHTLRDISPHAYLKTSAIRQCVQELSSEVRAAVTVDADTIVYPNWLRDLVTPLVGSDVGLVTGNRWYDPTLASWGSRIRFIYNAWAITPMYFMQATWGGSLALRREVYDQSFFLDRMWDTSCEDSAMQDSMRHAGFRLQVHPNVIILERESIDLPSCFRFIRRQLLWTRLYHPHWPILLWGTLGVYGLLVTATLLAMVRWAYDGRWEAALLLGAVALVTVANLWLIDRLHHRIASHIEKVQGITVPRLNWLSRGQLLIALPIALVVYVASMIGAALARRVDWRGITYLVRPKGRLEMVEYRPYATEPRD